MKKLTIAAVGAASTLALTVVPGQSMAVDEIDSTQLRSNVTVGGILDHERQLQRIANLNGGTRASGTEGHEDSAAYVERTLERAGYTVRQQEFTFPFFQEVAPATAEQVSPTPADYEVQTMTYSGSGDITGDIVAIDVQNPPPASPGSTSGCEDSDFPAAPAGEDAIALIQRGTCTFGEKAINADEAGYDAAIIFNEGQAGRTEVVAGTLGAPDDIPVMGMSSEDGFALEEQDETEDVVMHVVTETDSRDAETTNVIADAPSGDPSKTTVVGAHLDSVAEGPGINDNGSGSATLLEIAEEMAQLKAQPRRHIRFAFWGAEEFGLLGSEHYVAGLNDRQFSRIEANLNFDMVASPNYVRFVYDGDGSDTQPAGPPGSGQIEDIFTEYFTEQGLSSDPTQFSGRSDYGPFIAEGIPAGGLFTGAEGLKTAEQAAEYGGTADVAYDSCYHQACDTILNLNTQALSEMSDAAAHATWTLARSRSDLFGDQSRQTARFRAPKFEYSGSDAQR